DGLKRPERALFRRDVDAGREAFGLVSSRGGAGGDPLLDDGDHVGWNFLLGRWHLAGFQPFDEQAGCGIPRPNRRPPVPPFPREPLQAKIEIPLQLFSPAVAVETVRFEYWPDIPLKRWRFGRAEWCCRNPCEKDAEKQMSI